jgi:6-pyruvoyltetrahydropterin/6-carboxytetrahydropterin synthase
MYEILIRSDFSGAHHLRGYRGKCEELHGHNWKIEARFKIETLDKIGLAVDFKILKYKLKVVLKKLDHAYLNKLSAFKKENPSAENIARYIYDALKSSVKDEKTKIKSVSIWESETTCATYYA